MDQVMKEALKKIKPTSNEARQLKATTKSFLQTLNKRLKVGRACLGGSGAKGTWLAGNYDIDIFVVFPKSFAKKTNELSDLLEQSLKKAFPHHRLARLHGSRDYFKLRFQNLDFEVVPVLRIQDSKYAVNITDVSPLHALWVKKLPSKKKDEIRLAKKFFKANKLYGAESYISGFSGYVLEILVAYYGSLKNLLQDAVKWKIKRVIDIEQHYRGKNALFELNKSKTISPLIVIDPVDSSRNAAAALSNAQFLELKKVARTFLKKPSSSFFEKEEVTSSNLRSIARKKKLRLVYMTITPTHGKQDVVGAKLAKAFHFLQDQLKNFDVAQSNWDWDQKDTAIFFFLCREEELPPFFVRQGPPSKLKDAVKNFKKKNKDTYMEGGRVMARIPNQYQKIDRFVHEAIKKPYFKEKIKSVRKIES